MATSLIDVELEKLSLKNVENLIPSEKEKSNFFRSEWNCISEQKEKEKARQVMLPEKEKDGQMADGQTELKKNWPAMLQAKREKLEQKA